MATLKEDHRRSEDSWHLDKKVPLSLIMALLVQSGMVIYAVADVKKDVEYLKLQVITQESRDNRQDVDRKEDQAYIREVFKTFDAKLDRLIERSSHK
jgi:hypothetical protein